MKIAGSLTIRAGLLDRPADRCALPAHESNRRLLNARSYIEGIGVMYRMDCEAHDT